MKPENILNNVSSTNAVSGSNALKINPQANSNGVSNITQFPGTQNGSNVTASPSNNPLPTDNIASSGNNNPLTSENNSNNNVASPSNNEENVNQEEQAEELKPGDKVDTGKQINENGEVEDSSTKKTLKAVGRGAAAYFSGGSTIGKDQAVLNSQPVDKAIGVISDTAEKVPGVEEISKALDEAGLADGVNDALDVAGNIKNGDIGGTVESAKKLAKDGKKVKKFARKKLLVVAATTILPLFFIIIIFVALFGPVLGGFVQVVEDVKEFFNSAVEVAGDFLYGENEVQTTINIVSEIPDYENLGTSRQGVLNAAATAVAANIPYQLGSHASAPGIEGIPEAGLDCSSFVEWALWTGTGTSPGYLTTGEITNRIGGDFIEISKEELQPGDIGLKRRGSSTDDNYNHTGIYAGNGQWFHASGGSTKKVVRNNYSGFTIYLRYTGVD